MSDKRDDDKVNRREFLEQTGAVATGAAVLTGCATVGKGKAAKASTVKAADDGPQDQKIVRARIHPGIGVARVGNSVDGLFIGPEVVDPPLTKAGASRDAAGALKRQAARFRVFGYNAAGEVVKELTVDNAKIAWNVHLANKKAAWFRFYAALDMDEANGLVCPRRNAGVTGPARAQLVVDPGARKLGGPNVRAAKYRLNGKFKATDVALGEVRTDELGRLLVLGGHGKSGSPSNAPVFDPANNDTFNNADDWYDDIADGPVEATVTYKSKKIPVDGAWVIVGPPNYAPDVIGWRTLYDLLVDTYVESGMMPAPATTSFTQDVLPALRRLANLQWVNKGFAKAYAKGSARDFEDPAFVAKLAARPDGETEADPNAELRQTIFAAFRHPELEAVDRQRWPWLYGDAYGSFQDSVNGDLSLSKTRFKHLQRWAHGEFVNDWNPEAEVYRSFESVPVKDQPAMLDRAALHFCLADAFHPGCEVTWPMRHASLFRAPFRIKQRAANETEPALGETLTRATALGDGGPLHAQGPGDLTKWMAVPWQGDTIFCRSGYEPQYDPYLPTFWPARVPNHVLSEADYRVVMDATKPREQRVAAFKKRTSWTRVMTGAAPAQMLQMVAKFGDIGVVEARPGVEGDAELPKVMLVESLPHAASAAAAMPMAVGTLSASPESTAVGAAKGAPGGSGGAPEASVLEEAGWESQEQLDEFRRIRMRRPRGAP